MNAMSLQDTPKTKVYIDVNLCEERRDSHKVAKLTATLTLPDLPSLARHATMTVYANEVFEPYQSKNGGPDYPFTVTTSATDDAAVLEAVEIIEQSGQGTLRQNFEQIVNAIKDRRTKPVAGIAYNQGTMFRENGRWQDLYDIKVRVGAT